MAFPPSVAYPEAIDSDYTLFLVYNTTETRLCADNPPWSQEIDIIPVAADKAEIWAENGFANIDGELLYYDSVGLNDHGKVNKLKGCSRQLGGKTKFNRKGTWIRSYLVAEHHNQLVDCTLKMQNFIGYNFDDRQETLDWRIRNLQELEIIFDDFNCPDVNFTWNVVEDDPVSGVLAEYIVELTPPGSVNSFRLDFGDGEFTTTELTGSHRYAINARIDPIVSVSNDKCQILQTPIERDNPAEPPPIVEEDFDFPVPEFPEVPDFNFVPCEVPEPEINLPPLVTPCPPGISITGGFNVPSVIDGPDINMVSNVIITSNNPVNILHSIVTIVGAQDIPEVIILDPPVPPTIVIDPPIPPTIVLIAQNSSIQLELDATSMPRLEVDWGTPPEMEVTMAMARRARAPERFATDPDLVAEFGSEFADLFQANESIKVEYEPMGIPEEIVVVVPDEMPKVEIDASEIRSTKIKIDAQGLDIPKDIYLHGPETPIPNSIVFDAKDLIGAIDMLRNTVVKVESDIPTDIQVHVDNPIPEEVIVRVVNPFPEKMEVVGIPDKIILEGPTGIPLLIPENFGIPLLVPDVMPAVEMRYSGAPIEVKITMDQIIDKQADGRNCVMIVPCPTANT